MTYNRKMNLPRKKLFLKTRTEFDGASSSGSGSSGIRDEGEGTNLQLIPYRHLQQIPNSLVIQALILQACKHMEQDKQKRRELYSAICRILNDNKFLGVNISLDELWPLKESFCNIFSRFFSQVHKNVCSQGLGSCTSVSIRGAFDYVRTDHVHFPNRYQQSFEEMEIIAKGGFGVVCKARNKVDNVIYAVKKIKFKYTNDLEFQKVLREVRSFAQLKHQNIVNYNNSWLETNIGSVTPVKADSDAESDSEMQNSNWSDGEKQNSNSSDEQQNTSRNEGSHDHAAAPVFNLSSVTSLNSERNRSEQSSNLTSLLIDSINCATNIKSHSLMFNSEIHISPQNVVIEESVETSETKTEWQYFENRFCEYSASESHQTIDAAENSDAKCNFTCHQANNSADCSQTRRRRHSSGPTCSATDQDGEIDPNKKTSRRRSYDRFNSLDLDPKRCNALVPTAANTKWDISNLGVMAILYIQMELCDKSLRDWLDERAEMPPSSVCEPSMLIRNPLKMFGQIVQGVEHIHSKSIIHRDLKPKNIFLCSDGFIKIGDFGLAALCTQTDQQEFFHTRCSCSHTQGLGTVPYSAPEQRNLGSYDTKVDIYSLGIILIELIHCCRTRMEFYRTVDKFVEGSVPTQFVLMPQEVVNLIQRLLSKTPQERPEAKEILTYLQGIKMPESLAISNGHQDFRNKESEALEILQLKARVYDLEKQLLEKDEQNKAQVHSLKMQLSDREEKIKELQLKLLYMSNCDSFV